MSEPTEEVENASKVRGRPRMLVLAIGFGFAGIIILSGIAGKAFHHENTEPVTRVPFEGIPLWLYWTFYGMLPVMVIWGSLQFANRVKNWERGKPDNRGLTSRNAKKRAEGFRAGVYMQTLMRDPAAGVMHSLLYFSFVILLAVTTILEIDHQAPEGLKFLRGGVYQAYSFVGDFAGLTFTIGAIWAIIRRYVQKPYRIRIKSRPEHAAILIVFLAIGLTGFLTEAVRIAEKGQPEFEQWAFVGYGMSYLFTSFSPETLANIHTFLWGLHVFTFFAFVAMLPVTMLRHIFTSPLNMWLKDKDRPKGAMKPMPNLMETELESFGASVIEDFTWKQLLDTDACTMCGRCTAVCPAHATGKPLDPREIVLKTGEVMARSGNPEVSPPIGVDSEITVAANSIWDRITPEEVWACTTCKACDENCPVNIEILDKILDMRRYLSLMESNFPTELGNAHRAMENQGNPWGMNQGERADWAAKLDGIEIVDGTSPFNHEYLYWVGCGGSFDDKNKKVTQAMAKLLQRADIDFAILGPSEMCTGDSARRSGNEYVFQMLAMQNIETLNGMGAVKIITQCPHCFNTLKNEYPQLGGNYEVVHHSQFLEWLVDTGKLDLSSANLDERIVYHDSCYLGRHNDVYMAPRKVVGMLGNVEVVEAPRNGTKGMCCGAGGARMWMEEHTGKQVNVERSQELIATGASRIATACPFCYIMIDDGVKGEGLEEDAVKVADIAMHVLDAIEAGERTTMAPVPEEAAVAQAVSD